MFIEFLEDLLIDDVTLLNYTDLQLEDNVKHVAYGVNYAFSQQQRGKISRFY